MDKNQATGLILIAIMLITYFSFFAPDPEQIEKNDTQVTESIEQSETKIDENEAPVLSEQPPQSDSLVGIENKNKYGVFANGGNGNSQQTVLENSDIKITFDSKGAIASSVILKGFNSSNGSPIELITPKTNEFQTLTTTFGKSVNLNELYYQASSSQNDSSSILIYTLELGQGKRVIHTYTLAASGYELGYNLALVGLNDDISKDELVFQWNDQMISQERDVELSRQNSTVNFFTISDGFDELSERSTSYEEEIINEPIKWTTIKQRFFLAGLIAEKSFSKGKFVTDTDPSNPDLVKSAEVTLSIPLNDVINRGASFKFYYGPNDYHITKNVAEDFSKNLFLGWPPMLWVNKYIIIPLFDFFNNFIGNYGLIIILIVLIIKLVLSPLSYKSYLSMAKMKVLKPELDEIKEKHDGDMAKAQQDQMKLYQQVGVNPISGCIPMLLQMPIILSMFYFFPQSIELRGKSFLWAEDLSTFDSILSLPFEIPFYGDHVSLFVLLMTGSTILITYSQQQVSSVQGPMKSLSYMMPVIFMFVLNSYPAALSFYYFISNIVTFGQQVLIRRFVDEEKIRKVLEENKKNAGNRKKSKFQQRLEDAMKAQAKKKGK